MRFQMLTGDTLAFSYSSWVIVLRNSLAHERQIKRQSSPGGDYPPHARMAACAEF
jgi:hypothetical protein